jgi:DNA polymerase-3 subunit beta
MTTKLTAAAGGFSVQAGNLKRALASIMPAISGRSPLPILTCAHLVTEGDQLTVTCTDRELFLKTTITVSPMGAIDTAIPARTLASILSSLPVSEEILLTQKGGKVGVTAPGAKFDVLAFPGNEYPTWPDIKAQSTICLLGRNLVRAIEQTEYACSTDYTRAHINGVFFKADPGEGLTVVATDTHRLSKRTLDYVEVETAAACIVPRRALMEIIRACPEDKEFKVPVTFGDIWLAANIAGVELVTRLIEGTYPNYSRVIPVNQPHSIRANREAWLMAVRQVAITSEDCHRVVLNLDPNLLTLSTANRTIGSADREVEVSGGLDWQSALNHKFLAACLSHIETETVCLSFSEPLKPMLIQGVKDNELQEDYLCVLMPMNIV